MEETTKWAVKRLKNHRYGGPSGMRLEHLKGWLEEVQREEAASEKSIATEGTVAVIGGIGGGAEEKR